MAEVKGRILLVNETAKVGKMSRLEGKYSTTSNARYILSTLMNWSTVHTLI